MPRTVTEIIVFVASPGDVSRERRSLNKVVSEINHTIGEKEGFRLSLKKWETHTRPAMGRAQGVINQQLGPSDIFLGIMWKRFGTPTGKARSGTEEEFNLAHNQWKRKTTNKPEILFYFRESGFYPKSEAELEQVKKVQAFRSKIRRKALIWSYKTLSSFPDIVRPHLIDAARTVMQKQNKLTRPRSKAAASSSRSRSVAKTRRGSKPKNPASRQPRLNIPRFYTASDKARYLSRSFTSIKRYLKKELEEINSEYRGIQAMHKELEDGSFWGEVTSGGKTLNRIHIKKQSAEYGNDGYVSFSQGSSLDPRYGGCCIKCVSGVV